MRDYNKVILMGNLAQDPEMKTTAGSKQVTNFTIACNRSWTGPEGQESSEVSFIDCEIWGKAAKTIADHFSKGRPIFVEGRLKQETWTNKETQKKQSRLRVVVENFNFIDSKKSSDTIPAVAGNTDGGMTDADFDAL
jgi:single-strand DNA-binding protein